MTRLDLYIAGDKKAELINATNISYGYKFNDFVPLTFSVNANNLDAGIKAYLIEGAEIRVMRKGVFDTDYELVWTGELQEMTKSIDISNRKIIDCYAESWGNVFFKKRSITKTYTSQEEADIADDIIDTIQSDTESGAFTGDQVNWGITVSGSETTGNVRNRTYENDEVLTALQQLGDVLDIAPNEQRLRGFKMSPTLYDNRYHVFYWRSDFSIVRNAILETGQINSIRERKSIKDLATRVKSFGGDGTTVQQAISSSAILDAYKLRTSEVNYTNVTTNATLLEKAEDSLSTLEIAATDYDIELVDNCVWVGEFDCGDIITVRYYDNEEFIVLDNVEFIVFGINITVDDVGREKASIQISERRGVQKGFKVADKLMEVLQTNKKDIKLLQKK